MLPSFASISISLPALSVPLLTASPLVASISISLPALSVPLLTVLPLVASISILVLASRAPVLLLVTFLAFMIMLALPASTTLPSASLTSPAVAVIVPVFSMLPFSALNVTFAVPPIGLPSVSLPVTALATILPLFVILPSVPSNAPAVSVILPVCFSTASLEVVLFNLLVVNLLLASTEILSLALREISP